MSADFGDDKHFSEYKIEYMKRDAHALFSVVELPAGNLEAANKLADDLYKKEIVRSLKIFDAKGMVVRTQSKDDPVAARVA